MTLERLLRGGYYLQYPGNLSKWVQPQGFREESSYARPISQNARISTKIGVLQVYGIIKLFEHTVF